MSPGPFSAPEDVFTWADSFTNLERNAGPAEYRSYRLDRMAALLDLHGHPERTCPVFHVAGTKGKGSTAALLAGALQASGERTGLYTSPHVATPLERIRLGGEAPGPAMIVSLGNQIAQTLERAGPDGLPGGAPTTFELLTLLAFLCFRESRCTTAVVEVGIGGRLDATNLISPEACLITPLDLEHTDVLGDTLEKIAAEKAGIIKPGVPVFIGIQPPRTRRVFREAARERGAPITFLEDELESLDVSLSVSGTAFTVKLRGMQEASFRLGMLGEFQAENAALAFLALRRTRPGVPVPACAGGFASALLPGRMEVRGASPPVVLDGAHTPLAVRRLLSSFKAVFPGEAVLIFGSVSGKKPREMAEILAPSFKSILISTPGTFKASDPEENLRIFSALRPGAEMVRDPAGALMRARELSGGGRPILVTGSFYMVAEIRRLLVEEKPDV
jgi:dihydrofolate synthase / folylpolyglutamate synthase